MDANKAQKLRDIGYEIKPTCGTCTYFVDGSDSDFGDCHLHSYEHLKHTGSKRYLSVVRYGTCNRYKETDTSFLHGFKEFVR